MVVYMKTLHILNREKRASITVEASLVLPFYIFSIMAFIYIIQILLVQEHIHSAMIQTGEYVSQYAYVYDYIQNYQEDEECSKDIKSQNEDRSLAKAIGEVLFLQYKLVGYMDEKLINNSCIIGGTQGIVMVDSKVLEHNDLIELKASYMIKIPFSFLGLRYLNGEQCLNIRGFTGYKPMEDNKDPSNGEKEVDRIVYITRTGTVYHTNEDCTHIRFDIRQSDSTKLGSERNENGGKYYPCESCLKGKKNIDSMVYITSNGDRYHISIECSRLKRSIIKIKYSEVKDKGLCSRCGK